MPKPSKKGSKTPSQGGFPHKKPYKKTAGAAQAQVSPADTEAQMQPGVVKTCQKQQVGKPGEPGAQRTQKTVINP